MRLPLLLATCALAACSPHTGNQAAYDTANSIGEPAPAVTPAPLEPAAPGMPGGLANDGTPVGEAPFTDESAQGAAQIIQTSDALIEAGKHRQAWALWENGGKASGMTAQAFAASFGKFAEYHANIGAPGDVDAGAGQRYVTVPVQVYGRLKDGNRPFNMTGTVTLHRTIVDGASAEQKSWRIRATDIKPRPGEAAPGPQPGDVDNRSTARYRCIDGSRIAAAFDPDKGIVTISRAGRRLATLKQERAASGIWYKGQGYEFRGKGDDMDFTAPGLPPLPCTAIR